MYLLLAFKSHNSLYTLNIVIEHKYMLKCLRFYSASCYFLIFHTFVDTFMAPCHNMSSACLVYSIGLMPCESKIRYYPTGSMLNRSAPAGGGGLEGTLGPGTSPYLLVPCNDLFSLSLKHKPRMHSLHCGKLPEPFTPIYT